MYVSREHLGQEHIHNKFVNWNGFWSSRLSQKKKKSVNIFYNNLKV